LAKSKDGGMPVAVGMEEGKEDGNTTNGEPQ